MKTAKEIIEILIDELSKHRKQAKFIGAVPKYHNETLGDTSFLLAGLLELLLKKNYPEWNARKWLDDSLISNFVTESNNLIIDGVMIFGEMDTTEQWTAPFSFEIELVNGEGGYKEFAFLFYDLDIPEITYEEFSNDRDYWSRTGRRWKYVINSSETII